MCRNRKSPALYCTGKGAETGLCSIHAQHDDVPSRAYPILIHRGSQASWLKFLSDIDVLPGALESSRASMIFSTCRERHEVLALLSNRAGRRCASRTTQYRAAAG